MPLENLQTLQDLEITGPAGSQQDESQYETIESDEQAGRPLQPVHPSALHQASQAHPPFGQPHTAPFYPPLLNSFGFDSSSTIPIDPGFLDPRYDHPAAPGPGGGGVAGFHRDPWAAQAATSVNMDSFMVAPTSLPQYNPSIPLVPGMSSFEPMVSTAWSMDGSIPSTSTSTSRGPTLSSSLSVPGTSTPASSQSPSSPRKVSAGMVEPSAANREAVPIHLAVQVEPGAEDQPTKKRRQPSGPKAPPKTIAEKRGHPNNHSAGFSAPQIPIAPAPAPVATTGDDNKTNNGKKTDTGNNRSSFSSRHRKTSSATTATTSHAPSGPPQPGGGGPSSSQHAGLTAQQQQLLQQPQPDSRARNREAANRCRAKSKVAAAELEATERAMGAEHDALTRTARSLREEVLSLKNQLLMHGNCDDDLIQQYLANSARLVGSSVLAPNVAGAGGPTMMSTVPGPPLVAGPPAIGGGVGVGSSSVAMHPAPPPGLLPVVLPPSSSLGAGTAAARGHQRGGSQRH